MTTGYVHRTIGLSVSAYRPSIDVSGPSYTPDGVLLTDTLGLFLNGYSHVIQALGGYWSAQLTFTLSQPEMDDWFNSGLNRHIEIVGPETTLVWEGFVNQVTYSVGTHTAVTGPLLQAVNRASVIYTPILDATTTPPVVGVQQSTTVVDDNDSRALYGVLEAILSQGQLLDDGTTDMATQIRDTYLAENAWPPSTDDIGLGAASQPSITLDCLGYVHRLAHYIVQDTTAATVQISNNAGTGKLQLALAADPNGMFSTNYDDMDNNAFLTSRYEGGNRAAWPLITELVGVGDVNDARYTFGIYDDRKATYAIAPTDVAYQHRIADANVRVQGYLGTQPVLPWLVRPARWTFKPDFLPGKEDEADRHRDPRFSFIENVNYTAPWDLRISSDKLGRFDQMIAKLAMQG